MRQVIYYHQDSWLFLTVGALKRSTGRITASDICSAELHTVDLCEVVINARHIVIKYNEIGMVDKIAKIESLGTLILPGAGEG